MAEDASLPGWKDTVLGIAGPLTASRMIGQAMLRDLGSPDHKFIEIVRDVRRPGPAGRRRGGPG